jgi:hypothetical protein
LDGDNADDLPAVLGHYASSLVDVARQFHARGQDSAAKYLVCVGLDLLTRGWYAAEYDRIGTPQHGLPWRASKLRVRGVIDKPTFRKLRDLWECHNQLMEPTDKMIRFAARLCGGE